MIKTHKNFRVPAPASQKSTKNDQSSPEQNKTQDRTKAFITNADDATTEINTILNTKDDLISNNYETVSTEEMLEIALEVLPHAVRNIRNFMLNSLAEGRNDEDDDETGKGTSMTCVLKMADVDNVLDGQRDVTAQTDPNQQIQKSVDQSTDVAMRICGWKPKTTNSSEVKVASVSKWHNKKSTTIHNTRMARPGVRNIRGLDSRYIIYAWVELAMILEHPYWFL